MKICEILTWYCFYNASSVCEITIANILVQAKRSTLYIFKREYIKIGSYVGV